MAITRTAIVDDDGSGTTGTVCDNTWKQELYDQIDDAIASTTTVASTAATDQNNWAPGLDGHTTVFWSGASDINITGIAGGISGQRFTFRNTGTKVAYFAHQSGSSSAGNKFKNRATSSKTPVAANGFGTWQHDGTDWQLIAHEQGAWITPTFAAGTYTGNNSMTWTVASGNVGTQRWRLNGKTIEIDFYITGTSVGGTLSTLLQISNAAYGGFTFAGKSLSPAVIYNDAGAGNLNGFIEVADAGTSFPIAKLTVANWSSATSTTKVFGQARFPVN